jgi:polysaccharide export outer membrane protein
MTNETAGYVRAGSAPCGRRTRRTARGEPPVLARPTRFDRRLREWLSGVVMLALASAPLAEESQSAAPGYAIQPGDILRVSVWKEEDMQHELLVRPDGGISLPLAGNLIAGGHTVEEVEAAIVERIADYIPDPVVTVMVQKIDGNAIYVLGKVNRPGAYVMQRALDVTGALAMAGGLATFAAENGISILRRNGTTQSAIDFRYGDVQKGANLEQNILLQPGDVVIVP